MLDEPADLELPLGERHLGLFAEIEHRPVLHFVLTNRKLRHAVTVPRPASLRRPSDELDVDGTLVELNLPLNIFLAPFDEIVFVHGRYFSGHASRGWPLGACGPSAIACVDSVVAPA